MSLNLAVGVFVSLLDVTQQQLVPRQNLRQELQRRKEVDHAQHALLPDALVQGVDVGREDLVRVVKAGTVDDGADNVGDGHGEMIPDVERLPVVLGDLAGEVGTLLVDLAFQADLAHPEISQAAEGETTVFSPNLTICKNDACRKKKKTKSISIAIYGRPNKDISEVT